MSARFRRRLDSRAVLQLWTIYERPTDYPKHYVVREWNILAGKIEMEPFPALARTLEEARELLPPDCSCCLQRTPNDDPKIVESWL